MFKVADNLTKKNHYDLVVSEHHGVESFVCGCQIKKENDWIKHIAILWDPIKGQTITQYLPIKYINKRIERLERMSADYSSMIISTGTMRDYYNSHHDIAKDKRQYLGFPGVIRPSEEVPTDKLTLIKEGYINVVYSGQLSPLQRDPIPVIELFNRCQFAEKINLIFFATGNVEDDIKKIKFKGQFSYNGYIPLQELHTIYRHADYLLNISHTNPNMVPSKIFEYMSYGKPIISTFVTDGDAAAKTLANYPEALIVDLKKNDEANLQDLNLFLSKNHDFVDFEVVKHNYKENTPEAYLELIESVLK
jgi:glycosyltransferase involved in cell wall biosynthesis